MKLHINNFYNALLGARYALKYEIWYVANENFFRQFLNLKQELSFIEYSDQFSRLQDACGMEDDEEHGLISFLIGLRPDIAERMNDHKIIHEADWEAICLERMLKKSNPGNVTLQGKSPQLIADHVDELVAKDMLTENPRKDIEDSMTTFGPEFPYMGNDNQNIQAAREAASAVEIPHINSHFNFFFGDQQWKLGDERLARNCDLMV